MSSNKKNPSPVNLLFFFIIFVVGQEIAGNLKKKSIFRLQKLTISLSHFFDSISIKQIQTITN